MSRNNLPADWDTEEHPSLELLRQYQSGDLPAPLRHRLEQHLLSCELCSDMVEGMSLARPASVQTAVRETRGRLKHLLSQRKRKKKVFQWPLWQTAAVLLVLVFAMAEVVYHHYFAQPNNHFTNQTQTAPATWQLTGKVIDGEGRGLPGAQVQVKGSNVKTTSAPTGHFSVEIPQPQASVMVTLSGYQPHETDVNQNKRVIEITLKKAE